MFKKLSVLLFITISSTSISIASARCNFDKLSLAWEKNFDHYAEIADSVDTPELPDICFQQLHKINMNYEKVYYYLSFKPSAPKSLQEIKKLLTEFSVYMKMEQCPGKTEFQAVTLEAQDLKESIEQCGKKC